MKLTNELLPLFEEAGWFEGRKVKMSDEARKHIPQNHPALKILEEFDGLKVGETGTGITCAKSDVEFELCEIVDYEIETWNKVLNKNLILIASAQNSHNEIYIDDDGKCYSLAVHLEMAFTGENFNEAMKKLLFGIRDKPMILPNEDYTTCWGEKFTWESPDIYDYRNLK